MTKLDKIKIQGFKSIRDVEFELHNINILIGPNGAGKSNFIGAFKMLNNIVEQNLQVYVGKSGGAERLLHFGSKETPSISMRAWFGVNGYSFELAHTDEDSFIFEDETAYFYGAGYDRPHESSPCRGHRESLIRKKAEEEGKAYKYAFKALESWRIYHFHDTSDTAKMKKAADLNDNSVLRHDASNLPAFLYYLEKKHVNHFENIVDTIRLVAPFFDRFNLKPLLLAEDKIELEWRQNGTDAYFNAASLSDGTLRFICLATLLLQPNLPTTILLDEPELGLHPYAITILSELLKSAATKTQVVVSTQSVTLVNQFAPKDIVVVEMPENETVMSRLSREKIEGWMEEYALGELWEKNIFGGRPS
jgi:predicted ATPase